MSSINNKNHVICFSHLRWDFVYQRPQHLMSRFADESIVYYVEEPVFEDNVSATLSITPRLDNLWVCVPQLPNGMEEKDIAPEIHLLLSTLLSGIDDYMFWYYTPMALKFTLGFNPSRVIYDCMDELSAFKFAPVQLVQLEKDLMATADIVFTGGQSLYEAKKSQHANIQPFPSSIDKMHFNQARKGLMEPADQAIITGFKIGFYGVIDERFDTDLIAQMAIRHPEWQIILIGPVVKIDPKVLPRHKNIHYLGSKNYDILPYYLSGWDVALIPFLLNESTVFISPTKTPEYLAGGKPVVSTAIQDVISGYGVHGAVEIGRNVEDFIRSVELYQAKLPDETWLRLIDELLLNDSWDNTFEKMTTLIKRSYIDSEIELYSHELVDEKLN